MHGWFSWLQLMTYYWKKDGLWCFRRRSSRVSLACMFEQLCFSGNCLDRKWQTFVLFISFATECYANFSKKPPSWQNIKAIFDLPCLRMVRKNLKRSVYSNLPQREVLYFFQKGFQIFLVMVGSVCWDRWRHSKHHTIVGFWVPFVRPLTHCYWTSLQQKNSNFISKPIKLTFNSQNAVSSAVSNRCFSSINPDETYMCGNAEWVKLPRRTKQVVSHAARSGMKM